MKSITFLLPGAGTNPIGGYKVVYEYANRLQLDGFNVKIIYAASLFFKEQTIGLKIRSCLRYLYRLLFQNYTCKSWFKLEKGIEEIWIWSLDVNNIPVTDIIVATSWETAEYLDTYSNEIASRKLYLIQGYEVWKTSNIERLLATWKSKLEKIVIAPWLQDIANKMVEKSILIENGFDLNCFKLNVPIAERNPYNLCMLYHTSILKGFQDGFRAIKIVREIYPHIRLNLFGVYKKPSNLPDWVNYFQKPDKMLHNRIYNESSIFIGPSHTEGFCLTPPEAMLCGCAIVCTDIGGYTVLCKHEETALISPVNEAKSMADNIIRLIRDQNLRFQLAKNGNNVVRNYTWDRSYGKLLGLINNVSTR